MIDDEEVESVSVSTVDPIVDGHLKGNGAPFDDPPDLVILAASLMVVSTIYDDRFAQTGKSSEWGDKKWDRGIGILNDLKTGKMAADGVTSGTRLLVSDPTKPKASTSVFTGDETDWTPRRETKATS